MADRFIKVERDFTLTKSLDETGEFEGYASVFAVEDHHGDTIKKGAFKTGLAKLVKDKRKVKMLFNHDRFSPIGVFKEADEDDKGLYVRGKLTLGVQKADETRLLMLDEAIDSMSIGGYVRKDLWDMKTGKRELQEIELREISHVVFPALDQARILSVKSLADDASVGEVELVLRDVGFSQKDSKRLISIIKGVTPQRDVGQIAGSIDHLQRILKTMKG
jgi:HK97 family phage prohead protease